MARTDAHRPAAIVPADYEFVAFRYFDPEPMAFNPDAGKQIAAHMDMTGGKYSNHAHGGSCHICGAHALYTAVFYHSASNAYIVTGLDCAEKMDMDCGNGDAFRKVIRAAIEANAGKRKAKAILDAAGMSEAFNIFTGPFIDKFEESTIRDIVGKLVKYGIVSDKQMSFVQSLLNKIANRASIAEARKAEGAASKHVGTIGKRQQFDNLTCMFRTGFESAFGYCYIHGFKDSQGNVIIYKGSNAIADRGDLVTIQAMVKAHGEREGTNQTIINRPKVISKAAKQEAVAA